jgi:hypothetical protein
VGNGLAAVLGNTSKLESLGQVEGGGGADLALSLALSTLKGSLLGIESLVLSNYEIERVVISGMLEIRK